MQADEIFTTQNILWLFVTIAGLLCMVIGRWLDRLQMQVDRMSETQKAKFEAVDKDIANQAIAFETFKSSVPSRVELSEGLAKIDNLLHRIYDKLDAKQDKTT